MDPAGLRPLGVGEILDVAIKIYRARFTVLVKAVAVVVGPVFAISALIRISLPTGGNILSTSPGPGATPDFQPRTFWTFLAGTLVIGLLGIVAAQMATGASFKAVSGAYLDESPDWRECIGFARSHVRSLVWLSFVLVLLLIPAMLAFLVPGIYLYAAWAVAAPVLLLEGIRGKKALKRSRQLVKGRWWSTAAVLLLSSVLAIIVNAVFLGLLVALVNNSGNEVAKAVAQAIGQTVSSALTTPFTAAVITVLYFDLRVRKEGFDLELLARRLGVDKPPSSPPPLGWRPPDG